MNVFSDSFFNVIFNIVILLMSVSFLWKGADFLVESASKFAEKLGLSDLVIGLTIVAFGTSAPEFAVTVSASIKDQSSISVGNIVGSNIFNTGFILGAVAIVMAINATRKMIYRDGLFMLAVSLLLLFFFRDMRLEWQESLVFLILLATYLIFLFIKKEPLDEDIIHAELRRIDYFILPASIAAVVAGGHFLVESSSFLARTAGVSEWIIGVTIVAFGTSAPEMATSLAAVLKGKHGMSAGNLIGSNLFNILGVLGVAGMCNTLIVTPDALIAIAILCVMAGITLILLRTGMKLVRWEGVLLVALSIISYFIIFENSL